jgi:hypothetical protein
MVDNFNPTNQFHPYQAPDATPHADRDNGLDDMLRKVGINSNQLGSIADSIRNGNIRQSIDQARDYARKNPALVLGGLTAVVIGAGWMRRRP